jgi:hypothetical protein
MTIKLNIKRSKKKITPYGGTIVLKKAINELNIRNDIDKLIPKGKSNRAKKSSDFILPTVIMLHTGGVHFSDLDIMSEDETLKNIHNITAMPHSTTVGAWCKRHGGDSGLDIPRSSTLKQLEKINSSILLKGLRKEKISEVTLDIDATMIGAEKEESGWTYKKFKGMSSLMGFIAETGYIAGEEFRNGNISPSTNNYEFMLHCINNIEQSGKVKVTTFRSDSAGYQGKIIDKCTKRNITFYIGAVLNASVVKAISLIPENEWQPFINKDGEEVANHKVASFRHTMQDNDSVFRIIVERKLSANANETKGKIGNFVYRVITTNFHNKESEMEVIRNYNQRGTCENYIKEAKYGFSLKHLPCGTVRGNAVWFKMGMLAYNIAIYTKRVVLKGNMVNKLMTTIRYQIYNIPAQIVKHAGKYVLKLFCSKSRFNNIAGYFKGNYLQI